MSESVDETSPEWPFVEVAKTGQKRDIDDVRERYGTYIAEPWPETVERALFIPVVKQAQSLPIGVKVAGISPRRPLDEKYISPSLGPDALGSRNHGTPNYPTCEAETVAPRAPNVPEAAYF